MNLLMTPIVHEISGLIETMAYIQEPTHDTTVIELIATLYSAQSFLLMLTCAAKVHVMLLHHLCCTFQTAFKCTYFSEYISSCHCLSHFSLIPKRCSAGLKSLMEMLILADL